MWICGTTLFGLYGGMLLDRVLFFCLHCQEQVNSFYSLLSGSEPVLNRVWYYKPRDVSLDDV